MAWRGPFNGVLARLAWLGIWLSVATAGEQDPVLARVLSVGPDRVTLTVEGPTGEANGQIVVPLGESGLPDGVESGSLVRIWPGPGGPSRGSRLVPLEQEMAARDRTGVRARLLRGARRGSAGGRGGR